MTVFIRPGLIVRDRMRTLAKGAAIVVGPAAREGQYRICRWRGQKQHWSLPVVVAKEQLEAVADWTTMPLTEAKRFAAAAFERNYLVRAMETSHGSVVDAARLAGVDRSNFRRLLQRHALVKALRPKRRRPARRRRSAKRGRA